MSKTNKRLLRMGFILLAVLLCVSLIALPACAPAEEQEEEEEEEEVITLRIATFFGSTTDQCLMLDAFADALESESGGLLDIERYWGGTLGTGAEMYPAAADGSIDIVFVPLLYTPGRFPPMTSFANLSAFLAPGQARTPYRMSGTNSSSRNSTIRTLCSSRLALRLSFTQRQQYEP